MDVIFAVRPKHWNVCSVQGILSKAFNWLKSDTFRSRRIGLRLFGIYIKVDIIYKGACVSKSEYAVYVTLLLVRCFAQAEKSD